MKTAKEYRDQAAEVLKGNYGTAIGLILVYSLLLSFLTVVGVIGSLILGGAITLGIHIAFMNLIRGKKMNFSDLFSGFSDRFNFGSTISYYLLSALRIFLWSLLLIVPGFVATYSYSMAPYILADHPEMTGTQAVNASRDLMKGKKGKLFCLDLSYIGWILLGILTCGILLFWVEPKMEAAHAAFYEDIKNEVKVVA